MGLDYTCTVFVPHAETGRFLSEVAALGKPDPRSTTTARLPDGGSARVGRRCACSTARSATRSS
ncbi:hypothetical protein [Actinoplanes sp. G11-F43]|uniref:hypothetical protein n=1 Tax=Actinoplanes sp. G11-F43 TaxID=3424130 RepID=UPI003D3468C9